MKLTNVRLFPLLLILSGVGMLGFGVKSLIVANASKSWPTAQGKIISSSVEVIKHTTKDKTSYHANVLYEYTVGGQTQTSHDVTFGNYGSNTPSYAQGIVNKYPTGSDVTVYYSPSNPSDAVLETGISKQTLFLPGFGAAVICVGFVIFMRKSSQDLSAAKDV